jgi:hypothetical protein
MLMATLPVPVMPAVPRQVPRSLTELGRIRAGHRAPNKSGKGTHPASLLHWRVTSKNRGLLEMMAQNPDIGGTVQRWDGAQGVQYELYTTTDTLSVCIPTFKPVSLSYELWSAAGCQRRCDGMTVERCPLTPALVGQPCQCPEDDHERAALAAQGKACHRTLRVWVLLPDVPGVGFWQLTSHGFYAASELLGQFEVWQQSGMQSGIIEGTLRLEHREQKRPGAETLQYVVPVFTTNITLRQMALAAKTQQGFLVQPAESLPPQLSAAQHAEDIFGPGAGARLLGTPPPPETVIDVEPLPPTDIPPSTASPQAIGLRTAIDTLLREQGLEPRKVGNWHRQQAQKYAVETWAEMPVAILEDILARLEAAVQKAHAMQPTEDAEAPQTAADPEAWRQPLLELATTNLALLDGSHEDEDYAAYVRENCTRAQEVLHDPQTTADDADDWFTLLRAMSDKLSQQLGLEF